MARAHYRHTQMGWAVIVTLLIVAVLAVSVLLAAELGGWAAISASLFLLALPLLGTLTVSVDAEQIRLSFGIGLIRKRFALSRVRHFSVIRNPWYLGWGIHFYPGGSIYNVSGFGAVQLVFDGGKRVRIGTDQPERLRQAIEQVLGQPAQLSPEEIEVGKRSIWRGLVLSGVILGVIAVLLGGLMYLEAEPPKVSLESGRFKVESFVYSEEFNLNEITDVSLVEHIPRIRVRTNGTALGRTLRGHFHLDVLGNGELFIEHGRPPYLVVHRGGDYVIVNFEDPRQTEELYHALIEKRGQHPAQR